MTNNNENKSLSYKIAEALCQTEWGEELSSLDAGDADYFLHIGKIAASIASFENEQ